MLTQQDFNRRLAHVVMGIEGLAHLGVQLGHHLTRILVEQIDEALQHVQMEGGRDQLTMRTPLVS